MIEQKATYNVHEAKTHFSALVRRAEAGEHIIIARAGIPVAVLGPLRNRTQVREVGSRREAKE